MIGHNIFIDDERFPTGDSDIVRTMADFIKINGPISYISFDHDLGDNQPTGYDIAHYVVNRDIDEPGYLAPDFDFYVHSMNPIGADNIRNLMTNYLRSRSNEQVSDR